MKRPGTAIVWIRNDLRLRDNLALVEASTFEHVVPIFVWDEHDSSPWRIGSSSKWWLHHGLHHFSLALRQEESDLILLKGNPEDSILEFVRQINAQMVFWNQSYNPTDKNSVQKLITNLDGAQIAWKACKGNLLCSPSELLKDDQKPYLVYTAFWRNFLKKYQPQIQEKPKLPPLPKNVNSHGCQLNDFNLLPQIGWDHRFYQEWNPGEEAALKIVKTFLKKGIETYNADRDAPQKNGTSRLSPYLHFGEIHPQRILGLVIQEFGPLILIQDPNIVQFCKEILWREFSYHLLYHFPDSATKPLKPIFENFPWEKNKKYFKAWTEGKTGYPIVDAGMRQLWATGWMHNRVRMITASFLIKHLNIAWQEGAKWFWDTLVDADLASNTQGWQWTAGCGADASPFFRIFNPVSQGEKFDPTGKYVAQWCPELKSLPAKWIYRPWEAPLEVIRKAGIQLGETYPKPIIDHQKARNRALYNYQSIKRL